MVMPLSSGDGAAVTTWSGLTATGEPLPLSLRLTNFATLTPSSARLRGGPLALRGVVRSYHRPRRGGSADRPSPLAEHQVERPAPPDVRPRLRLPPRRVRPQGHHEGQRQGAAEGQAEGGRAGEVRRGAPSGTASPRSTGSRRPLLPADYVRVD